MGVCGVQGDMSVRGSTSERVGEEGGVTEMKTK